MASFQHTRFQFDRMEAWQREEVERKLAAQARLRDALGEQVAQRKARQEEERRLEREEEKSFMNTPREKTSLAAVSANAAPVRSMPAVAITTVQDPVSTSITGAGRRRSIRDSNATSKVEGETPASELPEGFSRMFEWQQEAILKKRREQEKNRQLLEEQIAEKQRQRESQKIRSQQEEAEESRRIEREVRQMEHPTAVRRPSTPPPQTTNPDPCVAEVPPRSETRLGEDISGEFKSELEQLRQQVEEQRLLLREQAALMQELSSQRQQGQDASLHEATETVETKRESPRKKSLASRSLGGKGKSEENKLCKTAPVRATLGKSKQVAGGSKRNNSFCRECTLRRDSAGFFAIEVDSVVDRYCIIKRVHKSFAQDDRSVLRPGDLITAIGSFNVKRFMANLKENPDSSLRRVLEEVDIPSFDQVQKMLSKGGPLLQFSVCAASEEEICRVVAQGHHRQTIHPQAAEERVPRLRQSKATGSVRDEEYATSSAHELDGGTSPLDSAADRRLSGSSTLVYEWNTVKF